LLVSAEELRALWAGWRGVRFAVRIQTRLSISRPTTDPSSRLPVTMPLRAALRALFAWPRLRTEAQIGRADMNKLIDEKAKVH